jgi:flagellar biosynthesis chaperone FliJ
LSGSLETLLEAEARAAEIVEKAVREAQAERSSIPEALEELESKYENALNAAEERETAVLATDLEEYRAGLARKRAELEQNLVLRARGLDTVAADMLRNRIIQDG